MYERPPLDLPPADAFPTEVCRKAVRMTFADALAVGQESPDLTQTRKEEIRSLG
jgi:hypothetical protein